MAFLSTLDITGSALTAQRQRMDTISQNISNINTTRTADGGPYRRQLTVFQERELNTRRNFRSTLEREAYRQSSVGGGVRVSEIVESENEFVPVYNPGHPDADGDGYVLMPNVDRAEEIIDLMAAQRSYESHITVLNVVKSMAMKAAEIGK